MVPQYLLDDFIAQSPANRYSRLCHYDFITFDRGYMGNGNNKGFMDLDKPVGRKLVLKTCQRDIRDQLPAERVNDGIILQRFNISLILPFSIVLNTESCSSFAHLRNSILI
jgi:hypothetical protein